MTIVGEHAPGTPDLLEGDGAGRSWVTTEVSAGPRSDPAPDWLPTATSALSLLALVLIGFVLDVSLVGAMRHSRDQSVGLADFRSELANAVAPIGPADRHGHPLRPGAPMAVLEMPSIGLRELVGQGTTSEILMSGPGHRRDTVFPGQVGTSVIFGRRAGFGGPFAHVKDLQPGDDIVAVTGSGTHRYRVLDVRRAADPLPPAPGPTEGRLILVTADGAPYVPSGVLRVDATLVSAAQGPPVTTTPQVPLMKAETALAGEASGLVSFVGRGALLLVGVGCVVWARVRWGRHHGWVIGVPVLGLLGVASADSVVRLLPNVL